MFLLHQAEFFDRTNFGSFLNSKGLVGEGVEIGTHRGGFARSLLDSWKGEMLHCVDPWLPGYDVEDPASTGDREQDLSIAVVVLQPHHRRVKVHRMSSSEAVHLFDDGSLCFVYVDGKHRRLDVKSDLEMWWNKLHDGGIMAGHDFLGWRPWAREVQPAVLGFADARDLTIHLVVEPSQSSWSYYMVKT